MGHAEFPARPPANGSEGSTPGIRLQSPKVVICIAEFIVLMQPTRVPRARRDRHAPNCADDRSRATRESERCGTGPTAAEPSADKCHGRGLHALRGGQRTSAGVVQLRDLRVRGVDVFGWTPLENRALPQPNTEMAEQSAGRQLTTPFVRRSTA